MRLRKLAALLGAAALTFGAVGSVSATAPTHHKIQICHATSSESNPYTSPTVDIASAGYPDGSSGHAGHGRDGVWYPGAKADGFDWGDIIRPYDYGDFHYDGLNWTDAGQAIYNNDCNVPNETHDPAIRILKSPSVTTLPDTGGEVTYTYTVTNTGDVELSDVSVTDDKCAPVTYVSGDTNDDQLLDLTETWIFTCKTTLTETTTNHAIATGHDGDKTVADDDHATVTVAMPPDEGYLKIEKEVDGGEVTGDFGFHVDCGEAGTFDVTVTFPDPGFVTIDDIAAGAVCDVTETSMPDAPAGLQWGEPTVTENPATIKDDDTVWVHFTNHLIPAPKTGSLMVTKVVDGAPDNFQGGSFDIHVDCGQDGTFDRTIAYPDPGSVTIDDIPAGAECTVTETGTSAAPDGLSWGNVGIDGSPATIVADGTADVTVTNQLVQVVEHGNPALDLLKTNNAPLVGTVQTADEGSTVTYTLQYGVTDGPLTLGVLNDVLPVGVTYVAGSATDSTEFEFVTYDAGTRTLTWTADSVTTPGSVTYQATVDAGAAALEQPLTNTATIDSEETSPVSDTSDVSVFAVVQPHGPTPPPTDLAVPGDTSSSGLSLMIVTLLLLGVAGGILAFAPTSIRKRKR